MTDPIRPPRYRDLTPDPWSGAHRWFPRSVSPAARIRPPSGLCAEGLTPAGAGEVLEILRRRSRPLVSMTVLPPSTSDPSPPQAQTLQGSLEMLVADEAEQIQGIATIGRTSHAFHLLHQPGAGIGLFLLFALDPLVQPNRRPKRIFRSTVGLALELAAVGKAHTLFLCPDLERRGEHETVLWTPNEPRQAA